MHFAHWSMAGLAAVLLFVCGMAANQAEQPSPLPALPAASSEFRGSGSCSAVACHGSIAPRAGADILHNEHTTWISDDRHASAFETLYGAQSERIMQNLAGGKKPVKPAYEDDRCLACHTTPRPAAVLAKTSWMNPDGVGCESCHGASGRWLGPHTTQAWKVLSDRGKKVEHGLLDTKHLARRAELCAGCHVGERLQTGLLDRDVSHDLIAAGHPRLSFELAVFLARMGRHWTEKDENADSRDRTKPAADFPARAWAIGRLTTLRASLELLAARAGDENGTPWPEFSEFGCFSCHHSLRDEPWPRATASDRRHGSRHARLGLVVDAARRRAHRKTRSDSRRPADQRNRWPGSSRRWPGQVCAGRSSAKSRTRRRNRCADTFSRPGVPRFQAGDVASLIAAIDQPEVWKRVASWDEAAQRYLALLWLNQAWVDLAGDKKAAGRDRGTPRRDPRQAHVPARLRQPRRLRSRPAPHRTVTCGSSTPPNIDASPRSTTTSVLAAVGAVPLRSGVGHGPRGLQRRRRRLGIPPARHGPQQGLSLGRGRHRRALRPLPAPRLRPGVLERPRPDPQGAALRPQLASRGTTARTSRSITSTSTTCRRTPT